MSSPRRSWRVGLALALPLLGGDAAAGTLSPSADQLAVYGAADPDGTVGLVQLLVVRDERAFARYREAGERAVREAGGQRIYAGQLDRTGPDDALQRFDALLVDECPRSACLAAFEAVHERRAAALESQFVIAMRPSLPVVRTAIRWGARLFYALFGHEVTQAPPVPTAFLVSLGADPQRVDSFLASPDERASLTMFNLNRYRAHANYPPPLDESTDITGEMAYENYSRIAIRHVLKRGGYPFWLAQPLQVFVGGEDDPLARLWDDFVLVHYPSRLALREMLNDPDYQASVHHRTAGIDAALVIPGTPWPAFDPAR